MTSVCFSSNFSDSDIIYDIIYDGAFLHLFYGTVSLSITQEKYLSHFNIHMLKEFYIIKITRRIGKF